MHLYGCSTRLNAQLPWASSPRRRLATRYVRKLRPTLPGVVDHAVDRDLLGEAVSLRGHRADCPRRVCRSRSATNSRRRRVLDDVEASGRVADDVVHPTSDWKSGYR